jgi:hypothetical protein
LSRIAILLRNFCMMAAWMKQSGSRWVLWVILISLSGRPSDEAWGAPPEGGEPFTVRLVHPDRQATEILRLFEGSRAASPAAALTAWKQSTRDPGQLGKPLEAVIAMFNPDMVREWRILDDAELHLDLDPASDSPRWFAIVLHDDGTLAAGITASRLTYPDDVPLRDEGRELTVARLGRSGVPLACLVGSTLIVGNSRAELLRGVHATPAGSRVSAAHTARPLDSGLIFRLDPARITMPQGGAFGWRRAVEVLHGLDCRCAEGTLTLRDGRLTLEVVTTFEGREPRLRDGIKPPVVEQAWLAHLPSSNVIAMISVAIDPDPASWDRAFGLADRVERVDPARAGVAPLRTRLNLLAAAAGVKPEADLWPHLRGLSACLWGDPRQPGRPVGGLLILHLDEESSAQRLAGEFAPRFGLLIPGRAMVKDTPRGRPDVDAPAGGPRRLGMVLGHPLSVWQAGRDLMIAWGDDALTASLHAKVAPIKSLATVCDGWGREGRGAPQRLAAIWPGRLGLSGGGPDPSPATRRVLAEDPPVVWWGWDDCNHAYDLLRWPDLAGRVRRFLETLPLDPPPIP